MNRGKVEGHVKMSTEKCFASKSDRIFSIQNCNSNQLWELEAPGESIIHFTYTIQYTTGVSSLEVLLNSILFAKELFLSTTNNLALALAIRLII